MRVFKASQMVALHNTPEHRERETNTHTKLKAYKMLMKDENYPCSFPPFNTASNQ